MKIKFNKQAMGEFARKAVELFRPNAAWRGAEIGALVMAVVIVASFSYGAFGYAGPLRWLIGFAGFSLLSALFALILTALLKLIALLPGRFLRILLSILPAVAFMAMVAVSIAIGIVAVSFALLILASTVGALLAVLVGKPGKATRKNRRAIFLAGLLISGTALILAGVWILNNGQPPREQASFPASGRSLPIPEGLTNPALPGGYTVATLTYGSGTDQRRPAYGSEANLRANSVDGTGLIENWGRLRERYWGFGLDQLPLNGHVWYPQEDGTFPLVLFVHGQHMMEDASEGGYAYLGELLASRGFIVVSVDENFINMSPLLDLLVVNDVDGENDLRGWLLLQHLAVWESWNGESGNPFHGKVDLDRIALIGHSRGGEAITSAALFNRLPCHPDDGTIPFDFDFNIRALVGLAPVDGQFEPRGQRIPVADVDYLVLHGAQDMDVFTFMGLQTYQRLAWQDGEDHFKAAWYLGGANHGQFNSSWGRKDLFEPVMRLFNLSQLMPAAEQEQIASVSISAFLEASLHGEDAYRSIFQDPRTIQSWLPDVMLVSLYGDSRTTLISTYEEDMDYSTASLPGAKIESEGLTVWQEQEVQSKYGGFGNHAVHLGWSLPAQEPHYTFVFSENYPPVSTESTLVFSMADANLDPQTEKPLTEPRTQALDLTVQVIDGQGNVAALRLGAIEPLPLPIPGRLGKMDWMTPFPQSEVIPSHYEIPLAWFAAQNPAFDCGTLHEIRFVFDQSESGMVTLDNIGLRGGAGD